MTLFETIATRIPVWVWLAFGAASVVAGDYFAKRWSLDRGNALFWVAVFFYAVASQFYLPTLLRHGLIYTSIIWVVLSTIGFLLLGTLVFHEELGLRQWIGVTLGFLAILLLSF